MTDVALAAGLCAGAFVLGGVPFGLLLGRAHGVDVRAVGSGNIGATNVGRALGRPFAVLVLALDAAKGWVATACAAALLADPWARAAVGLAAVAGHCYSVFLRGRGGKGVATAFGVALATDPVAALPPLAIYLVLVAALRFSSVGSLAGVATFPVSLWLLGSRQPAALALAVAMATLVVVRHKDNLRRLARGEELKA